MSARGWKEGDRVELVDRPSGKVYPAVIEALHGPVVHVRTNRGALFAIRADSPFLRVKHE